MAGQFENCEQYFTPLQNYFVSFFLLFMSLIIVSNTIWAQGCDPKINPSDNRFGYLDRGNRCEGMYSNQQVAGEFEVVSFIIGEFKFEWTDDVILEVTSPYITQAKVNIRGKAIPLQTYYRLDGTAPMSWPIADVLYPKRLNSEKIGVYGWVQKQSKKYVPLRVIQKGMASDESASSGIVLGIRSIDDIESVFWRYAQLVDDRCTNYSGWQKIVNYKNSNEKQANQFDRGDVIYIDLSTIKIEEACIEIQGTEQGSGRPVRFSVKVIIPGTL